MVFAAHDAACGCLALRGEPYWTRHSTAPISLRSLFSGFFNPREMGFFTITNSENRHEYEHPKTHRDPSEAHGRRSTCLAQSVRSDYQESTAQLPWPIGQQASEGGNYTARSWTDHVFTPAPFTAVFNCTGQPAMSLPLARSQSRLPIGPVCRSLRTRRPAAVAGCGLETGPALV